jgi:hypothetical protein
LTQEPGEYGRCRGIAVMTPRRLLHRLRFWRGWGRELPAEIDRRLRPLEGAGEKQIIIDIWVLRQLLNRPPRMAAERPTKLTKEASEELIAEAKDELAVLRKKAKGRRLRKSTGLVVKGHDECERGVLAKKSFGVVILDEAHKARASRGLQGRDPPKPNNLLEFLRAVARNARNVILGTATPIKLDAVELWDLLSLLNQGAPQVLGTHMDGVAKALNCFETYTKFRDFRAFHIEQAKGFKASLAEQRSVRTKHRLSKARLYATLTALKRFFIWLARQPGYKSRMSYSAHQHDRLGLATVSSSPGTDL